MYENRELNPSPTISFRVRNIFTLIEMYKRFCSTLIWPPNAIKVINMIRRFKGLGPLFLLLKDKTGKRLILIKLFEDDHLVPASAID